MSDTETHYRPYDPDAEIADRFRSSPIKGRVISSNERDVLRLVHRSPGISRSEMTSRIDLTQQSIYRIVDGLVARGMCCLEEPKPGTGRGQPSPTVFLDPSYACSIGISVGTDTINICIFDFAGHIRSTNQIALASRPLSQGLEEISRSVANQLNDLGINREKVFGAGFAISGFLEEGTTYNTPLPLQEWSLVELGPLISRTLGCPVWTGNISNAAAICEAMLGIGQHISSFAYLAFDFGFGGAIVINGELWRGGHGNAGELSAMFDTEEMPRRPALEYLLTRLNQHGVNVRTVNDIREKFDPNWPGVDAWIDQILPALNRSVNSIYAIMDPEAIIFGGQIPKALANELIQRINFVRGPRYGRLMKAPRLLPTELNIDAAAAGAAAMPLKAVFF